MARNLTPEQRQAIDSSIDQMAAEGLSEQEIVQKRDAMIAEFEEQNKGKNSPSQNLQRSATAGDYEKFTSQFSGDSSDTNGNPEEEDADPDEDISESDPWLAGVSSSSSKDPMDNGVYYPSAPSGDSKNKIYDPTKRTRVNEDGENEVEFNGEWEKELAPAQFAELESQYRNAVSVSEDEWTAEKRKRLEDKISLFKQHKFNKAERAEYEAWKKDGTLPPIPDEEQEKAEWIQSQGKLRQRTFMKELSDYQKAGLLSGAETRVQDIEKEFKPKVAAEYLNTQVEDFEKKKQHFLKQMEIVEKSGKKPSPEGVEYLNGLLNELKAGASQLQNNLDDYQTKTSNLSSAYDDVQAFKRTYDGWGRFWEQARLSGADLGIGVSQLANEIASLSTPQGWAEKAAEANMGIEIVNESEATHREWREEVQRQRHEILPEAISIGEVRGVGDFAQYATDTFGQFLPQAVPLLTGAAAPYILAASSAGGKLGEIKDSKGDATNHIHRLEQEIAEIEQSGFEATRKVGDTMQTETVLPEGAPDKLAELKGQLDEAKALAGRSIVKDYAITAAYGAAEYWSEKLGTVRLFNQGTAAWKKLAKDIVNKQVGFSSRKFANIAYDFGKESILEGGTEGLTSIAQNTADIVIGGEDKSLLDGFADSVAAGIIIGSGMAGFGVAAPQATGAVLNWAADAETKKLTEKNRLAVERLTQELNSNPNLSTEVKEALASDITDLMQQNIGVSDKVLKEVGSLEPEQITELMNLEKDYRIHRKKFKRLMADTAMSPELRQRLMEKFRKDTQALINSRDEIMNSTPAKQLEALKAQAAEGTLEPEQQAESEAKIAELEKKQAQQAEKTQEGVNRQETEEDDTEGQTEEKAPEKTFSPVIDYVHGSQQAFFEGRKAMGQPGSNATREDVDALNNVALDSEQLARTLTETDPTFESEQALALQEVTKLVKEGDPVQAQLALEQAKALPNAPIPATLYESLNQDYTGTPLTPLAAYLRGIRENLKGPDSAVRTLAENVDTLQYVQAQIDQKGEEQAKEYALESVKAWTENIGIMHEINPDALEGIGIDPQEFADILGDIENQGAEEVIAAAHLLSDIGEGTRSFDFVFDWEEGASEKFDEIEGQELKPGTGRETEITDGEVDEDGDEGAGKFASWTTYHPDRLTGNILSDLGPGVRDYPFHYYTESKANKDWNKIVDFAKRYPQYQFDGHTVGEYMDKIREDYLTGNMTDAMFKNFQLAQSLSEFTGELDELIKQAEKIRRDSIKYGRFEAGSELDVDQLNKWMDFINDPSRTDSRESRINILKALLTKAQNEVDALKFAKENEEKLKKVLRRVSELNKSIQDSSEYQKGSPLMTLLETRVGNFEAVINQVTTPKGFDVLNNILDDLVIEFDVQEKFSKDLLGENYITFNGTPAELKEILKDPNASMYWFQVEEEGSSYYVPESQFFPEEANQAEGPPSLEGDYTDFDTPHVRLSGRVVWQDYRVAKGSDFARQFGDEQNLPDIPQEIKDLEAKSKSQEVLGYTPEEAKEKVDTHMADIQKHLDGKRQIFWAERLFDGLETQEEIDNAVEKERQRVEEFWNNYTKHTPESMETLNEFRRKKWEFENAWYANQDYDVSEIGGMWELLEDHSDFLDRESATDYFAERGGREVYDREFYNGYSSYDNGYIIKYDKPPGDLKNLKSEMKIGDPENTLVEQGKASHFVNDSKTMTPKDKKKIRVFDFDDTLATTHSNIWYHKEGEESFKINAEEFANDGARLVEEGWTPDFHEFDKVVDGQPNEPFTTIAKRILDKHGPDDLFVLTARGPLAEDAIFEFMKGIGIPFKRENITGLGDSTGEAKAEWMKNKIIENGYEDAYFADDAAGNYSAMQQMFDKEFPDMKTRSQRAGHNFFGPDGAYAQEFEGYVNEFQDSGLSVDEYVDGLVSENKIDIGQASTLRNELNNLGPQQSLRRGPEEDNRSRTPKTRLERAEAALENQGVQNWVQRLFAGIGPSLRRQTSAKYQDFDWSKYRESIIEKLENVFGKKKRVTVDEWRNLSPDEMKVASKMLTQQIRESFPTLQIFDTNQEWIDWVAEGNFRIPQLEGRNEGELRAWAEGKVNTNHGLAWGTMIWNNEETSQLDTTPHEMGHLWLRALRFNDATQGQQIFDTLYSKIQDTEYYEREVKRVGDKYSFEKGTQGWKDEVLAGAIGRRAADLAFKDKQSEKDWMTAIKEMFVNLAKKLGITLPQTSLNKMDGLDVLDVIVTDILQGKLGQFSNLAKLQDVQVTPIPKNRQTGRPATKGLQHIGAKQDATGRLHGQDGKFVSKEQRELNESKKGPSPKSKNMSDENNRLIIDYMMAKDETSKALVAQEIANNNLPRVKQLVSTVWNSGWLPAVSYDDAVFEFQKKIIPQIVKSYRPEKNDNFAAYLQQTMGLRKYNLQRMRPKGEKALSQGQGFENIAGPKEEETHRPQLEFFKQLRLNPRNGLGKQIHSAVNSILDAEIANLNPKDFTDALDSFFGTALEPIIMEEMGRGKEAVAWLTSPEAVNAINNMFSPELAGKRKWTPLRDRKPSKRDPSKQMKIGGVLQWNPREATPEEISKYFNTARRRKILAKEIGTVLAREVLDNRLETDPSFADDYFFTRGNGNAITGKAISFIDSLIKVFEGGDKGVARMSLFFGIDTALAPLFAKGLRRLRQYLIDNAISKRYSPLESLQRGLGKAYRTTSLNIDGTDVTIASLIKDGTITENQAERIILENIIKDGNNQLKRTGGKKIRQEIEVRLEELRESEPGEGTETGTTGVEQLKEFYNPETETYQTGTKGTNSPKFGSDNRGQDAAKQLGEDTMLIWKYSPARGPLKGQTFNLEVMLDKHGRYNFMGRRYSSISSLRNEGVFELFNDKVGGTGTTAVPMIYRDPFVEDGDTIRLISADKQTRGKLALGNLQKAIDRREAYKARKKALDDAYIDAHKDHFEEMEATEVEKINEARDQREKELEGKLEESSLTFKFGELELEAYKDLVSDQYSWEDIQAEMIPQKGEKFKIELDGKNVEVTYTGEAFTYEGLSNKEYMNNRELAPMVQDPIAYTIANWKMYRQKEAKFAKSLGIKGYSAISTKKKAMRDFVFSSLPKVMSPALMIKMFKIGGGAAEGATYYGLFDFGKPYADPTPKNPDKKSIAKGESKAIFAQHMRDAYGLTKEELPDNFNVNKMFKPGSKFHEYMKRKQAEGAPWEDLNRPYFDGDNAPGLPKKNYREYVQAWKDGGRKGPLDAHMPFSQAENAKLWKNYLDAMVRLRNDGVPMNDIYTFTKSNKDQGFIFHSAPMIAFNEHEGKKIHSAIKSKGVAETPQIQEHVGPKARVMLNLAAQIERAHKNGRDALPNPDFIGILKNFHLAMLYRPFDKGLEAVKEDPDTGETYSEDKGRVSSFMQSHPELGFDWFNDFILSRYFGAVYSGENAFIPNQRMAASDLTFFTNKSALEHFGKGEYDKMVKDLIKKFPDLEPDVKDITNRIIYDKMWKNSLDGSLTKIIDTLLTTSDPNVLRMEVIPGFVGAVEKLLNLLGRALQLVQKRLRKGWDLDRALTEAATTLHKNSDGSSTIEDTKKGLSKWIKEQSGKEGKSVQESELETAVNSAADILKDRREVKKAIRDLVNRSLRKDSPLSTELKRKLKEYHRRMIKNKLFEKTTTEKLKRYLATLDTFIQSRRRFDLTDGDLKKEAQGYINDAADLKKGVYDVTRERAYAEGGKKDSFFRKATRWFIPPTAEDFEGLMYKIYGKGDKVKNFINEHIYRPYADGIGRVQATKQSFLNDLLELEKDLTDKNGKKIKNARKYLSEPTGMTIGGLPMSHGQAVRMYNILKNPKNWSKIGLTNPEKLKIVGYINDNVHLKNYANNITELYRVPMDIANAQLDKHGKPLMEDTIVNKEGLTPDNVKLFDAIYGGKDTGIAPYYPTALNSKGQIQWTVLTLGNDGLTWINKDFYKASMLDFTTNADIMFSDQNRNRLQSKFGTSYREALDDVLDRMYRGKNRPEGKKDDIGQKWLNWLNRATGAIMFFNVRAGILQALSLVNYLDWQDNTIIDAGKQVLLNPVQWKNDVAMLWTSDYLKDRRGGAKQNIESEELVQKAILDPSTNIDDMLRKGFTLTTHMDSFAIATGGASYYRSRHNHYMNKYNDSERAHDEAMRDFREKTEAQQQSSRPDRISKQQASGVGRTILAFANTPMQYNRLIKKAFLDIKNGRGNNVNNISKILFYGGIQNVVFGALQQGTMALIYGWNDDDEEERGKAVKQVNGILDTLLRGAGLYGAVIATIKTVGLEAFLQEKKDRPDHVNTAIKALSISPPLSSKVSKLMSAFKNMDKNRELIGSGTFHDPTIRTLFQLASVANVPVLEWLHTKMEATSDIINDEHRKTVSWLNLAGWSKWSTMTPTERMIEYKSSELRKNLQNRVERGSMTQEEVELRVDKLRARLKKRHDRMEELRIKRDVKQRELDERKAERDARRKARRNN